MSLQHLVFFLSHLIVIHGYNFQFVGKWKNLHPERVVVGRAVTCRWVPRRPDLHEAIDSQGKKDNRIGFQNSWVIDELKENDLIVVDLFGKIFDGTFAGDNLSTAIKSKTGTLMTINPRVVHEFSSIKGAIIEELSTTSIKSDSYYLDDKINKNKERKTFIYL